MEAAAFSPLRNQRDMDVILQSPVVPTQHFTSSTQHSTSMTSAYDVIGLIGSFIISAALVPQLTKVYRTKSANDISYPFLCMYITGLSFLAVYGIGEGLWPIYIPSTLELLGGIALLTMKIRYDENSISIFKRSQKDVEGGLMVQRSPIASAYVPALTPK